MLLVYDNYDNRFLILSYFKNFPYQIKIAEDGQQAIDLFTKEKFDLVIMDMQMPIKDGYTATREIRNWEIEQKRLRTPIIALTAFALKEDENHAIQSGCDVYITKPINKEQLLEVFWQQTKGIPDEMKRKQIESELTNLRPGYLERRKNEISQLKQAAQNKDFETIKVISHNIKGTAKTYGFETLESVAKLIYDSASSREMTDVETHLNEYEALLKQAS